VTDTQTEYRHTDTHTDKQTTSSNTCGNRAYADRRCFLIMSLSRITTWPTLSLQFSEINNIMYAVKTDDAFSDAA